MKTTDKILDFIEGEFLNQLLSILSKPGNKDRFEKKAAEATENAKEWAAYYFNIDPECCVYEQEPPEPADSEKLPAIYFALYRLYHLIVKDPLFDYAGQGEPETPPKGKKTAIDGFVSADPEISKIQPCFLHSILNPDRIPKVTAETKARSDMFYLRPGYPTTQIIRLKEALDHVEKDLKKPGKAGQKPKSDHSISKIKALLSDTSNFREMPRGTKKEGYEWIAKKINYVRDPEAKTSLDKAIRIFLRNKLPKGEHKKLLKIMEKS